MRQSTAPTSASAVCSPSTAVTLRSIVLGMVFAFVCTMLTMVSVYNLSSSWMVFGHMPVGVLMPFIPLVFGLNVLVKLIRPRLALTPTELTVVFVMGLVAVVIPEFRLTGYFLGVISAPIYDASAENRYQELLLDHVHPWLLPDNSTGAVDLFYRGLSPGQTIPWNAWVSPLFWWGLFFAALFAASLCIVVILRRQWEEHERLTFPLAQAPLAMVAEHPAGRRLPALFYQRAFWYGCAIPLFVILWNMVRFWYVAWPEIPLVTADRFEVIRFGPDFPRLRIRFSFFLLGFAFLANLDVLLSVWLFYLLTGLEGGILNGAGVTVSNLDSWTGGEMPAETLVSWQAFGCFTFLVLWGLWIARRHLRAVFRKALLGGDHLSDRHEFLGYRGAVVGLLVSLLFCVLFLRQAGMSLGWVLFFLLILFLLYIGNSKIIAQTGLNYVRTSMTAQAFTMQSFGTIDAPRTSMAALGLTFTTICDGNPFVMPSLSHATKLTSPLRASRRGFTLAMSIAALMAFVVSVWYSLYIGYERGAANVGGGLGSGSWVVNSFVNRLRNPIPADPQRATFFAIGGGLGALLTALQARVAWWPLHPVGLAVAMALPVKYVAFSAFQAWLYKLVVIKVGGERLYRRCVPFFLGLVVGYCFGVGLGLIVDALWFPGNGHQIHSW
jgi:hypothetical protein